MEKLIKYGICNLDFKHLLLEFLLNGVLLKVVTMLWCVSNALSLSCGQFCTVGSQSHPANGVGRNFWVGQMQRCLSEILEF